MKAQELYDYILQHMTAEKALMTLLSTVPTSYEALKEKAPDEKSAHPICIIMAAALELGWDLGIEVGEDKSAQVEGLVVGTEAFLNRVFKK